MTDREALLATILTNPDDDLARLVFADWLEEYGDEDDAAHAEWIRVGCELAKTPEVAYKTIQGIPGDVASYTAGVCESCDKSRPDRCQYHLLRIRESELHINLEPKMIRRNGLVGFSPSGMSYRESLRHTPPNVVFFDRGFIHAVACDSATWLDHGGELAKREPVEAVTLTTELPLMIDGPHWSDHRNLQERRWELRAEWVVRRTDMQNRYGTVSPPDRMGMNQFIPEKDILAMGRRGEEFLAKEVDYFRARCRATATVEGYLKHKWPKIKFTVAGGEPPQRHGSFVGELYGSEDRTIWRWNGSDWIREGRGGLPRYRVFDEPAVLMTGSPSLDYESYSRQLRRRMFDSLMISSAIYNPPITHSASWDDGGGSPIDDLRRAADEIRDQTRGE